MQRHETLYHACKWVTPPVDPGFHRAKTLDDLRSVLNIPDSELIARATAVAHHARACVTAGDTLTIEVTRESRVGLAVIVRNGMGETLIGVLQRDNSKSSEPAISI